MNYARLDDGRRVIVDSSRAQTRQVKGKEFFLSTRHITVLLEGSWQVVRMDRLKTEEFGNPWRGVWVAKNHAA